MPPPMERAAARGMTLLELLIAMSIFSVLGIFLFTLVGRSLEIYHAAEGQGEFIDTIDQAVTPLADDLACVYVGEPAGPGRKVQFLLTHDRRYVPSPDAKTKSAGPTAYATGDPRSLLLRFVRTYPGSELETTIGRFAGTYADADKYIDGDDDLGESRALDATRRGVRAKAKKAPTDNGPTSAPAAGLLPPGDLAEVMYFVERAPDDPPTTFTLYRAMRAPIGGPGSFFDDRTIAGMTPEWIAAHATPVATNVAYFAVLLWSQNTDSWDTERALDGEGARRGGDGSWRGGEVYWDSSRGKISEFGLAKGASSLTNYEDDVFPSRAQIIMTLAPEGRASGSGVVIGGVAAGAKFVNVSNPQPLKAGTSEDRFLKVGDEWMKVTSLDGRTATVTRAARQTTAGTHDSGAPYLVGRTFTKVIEIPAFRNYFKGPGE